MDKKNIISVKNLKYKNIFDGLDLSIKQNTITAISGSNNCGKTTLIKILSGLITVKDTVKFNDLYLESINKNKLFYDEGIVILNEKIDFLFDTVKEEILFVLDNINISDEKKKERYNFIIKLLNLTKYEKLNPNELKRNIKIKVLLAIAVIHKPHALFIDDLCTMMSKAERHEMENILNYLNSVEKMTIVMTTNNLEETINCDYLYILDKGKIALEGKPLDILKEDNIINKIGLKIPFMIDLSVKLQDYDLISEMTLDMNGMVNKLWK